jgi:hypothetical protein
MFALAMGLEGLGLSIGDLAVAALDGGEKLLAVHILILADTDTAAARSSNEQQSPKEPPAMSSDPIENHTDTVIRHSYALLRSYQNLYRFLNGAYTSLCQRSADCSAAATSLTSALVLPVGVYPRTP